MNLLQEIRHYFSNSCDGNSFELKSLPPDYPGIVFRIGNEFGVAIEIDDNILVAEKFNRSKFYTSILMINSLKTANYLILSSCFEDGRYEFASICSEFLDPGSNGNNRRDILQDPYAWWSKWKELIGNRSAELSCYNVIAEMIVLKFKFLNDSSVIWNLAKRGSHDIECQTEDCEVKSTIKRYDSVITITGQHQFSHVKPLWLYFCRMEESREGVSINDMVQELIEIGYDEFKIQNDLDTAGFANGSSIRNKKYKILEKRKYKVDDSFPMITAQSFKDNKIPDSIIRIEYTVNLDGIEYTTW